MKAHQARDRVAEQEMDKVLEDTSVLVSVRVRPLNKRELSMGSNISVVPTSVHSLQLISSDVHDEPRSFNFDSVLPDRSTQKKAYEMTGKRILKKVLEGYNGCIFAYGQTGSGKTYTMQGMPGLPGVIPRLVGDLFKQAEEKRQTTVFEIKASYVEIYNEVIRDLLGKGTNLRLQENSKSGDVHMVGCTVNTVGCQQDIEEFLKQGQMKRSTASTNMNEMSSRSHAILTLFIRQEQQTDGTIMTSKLSLIDLAGSERAANTGATGATLKEGASINQSLSALGNVINALTSQTVKTAKGPGHRKKRSPPKAVHVPYRDSKLTRLLQDSLGGNACTLMICNVSPAAVNFDETLGALRFAERAKKVQNKAKKNVESRNSQEIATLTGQNALLKSQVENLRSQLAGKFGSLQGTSPSQAQPDPKLVEQVDAMKKELEDSRHIESLSIAKLEEHVEQLKVVSEKHDSLSKKHDAIVGEKEKLIVEQEVMSQKIEELTVQLKSRTDELGTSNKKIKQSVEEVAMLNYIVDDLFEQLQIHRDNKQTAEQQYEEAHIMLKSLIKTKESMEKVSLMYGGICGDDLVKAVTKSKHDAEDLESSLGMLKANEEIHVSNHRLELDAVVAAKKKLELELRLYREKHSELKEQLESKEKVIAIHEDHINDLTGKKIPSLKQELEELHKEHGLISRHLEKANVEISEHIKSLENKHAEVAEKEAAVQLHKRKHHGYKDKIEHLQKELTCLQASIEDTNARNKHLEEVTVPNLRDELQQSRTVSEDLRRELGASQDAYEHALSDLETKGSEVLNLKGAHNPTCQGSRCTECAD